MSRAATLAIAGGAAPSRPVHDPSCPALTAGFHDAQSLSRFTQARDAISVEGVVRRRAHSCACVAARTQRAFREVESPSGALYKDAGAAITVRRYAHRNNGLACEPDEYPVVLRVRSATRLETNNDIRFASASRRARPHRRRSRQEPRSAVRLR